MHFLQRKMTKIKKDRGSCSKKALQCIEGHHPVPSLSPSQQRDGYSNVLFSNRNQLYCCRPGKAMARSKKNLEKEKVVYSYSINALSCLVIHSLSNTFAKPNLLEVCMKVVEFFTRIC